jgi:hypothetical protein
MKPATRRTKNKPDPNRYPKGLNREKVQKIIDHYENQTDEEAIAEAEAAYHNPATTMIEVPVALLPKIHKLLAKRAG